MSIRIEKLQSLLRQEVYEIITRGLPRTVELFSIVEVAITNDLSLAKVYISFIAADETKENQEIEFLNEMGGVMRHHLGKRLCLKKVPELLFILDHRIRDGMKVITTMDRVLKKNEQQSQLP